METIRPEGWDADDGAELYGIPAWGKGYVSAGGDGHLLVHPHRDRGAVIDLHEVVEGLRERGIEPPVVVRFEEIIHDRLRGLRAAFARAIAENEYRGRYICVYPVKVNQQRHVVAAIRDADQGQGLGLEVGSKPELLAVLGMTAGRNDLPIICNGFKDSEYIETITLAAKLGRTIIPVVEKASELDLIVRHAGQYDVRPQLGVRVKLAARGVGRWEDSAGMRSKFGLRIPEVLDALAFLRERGMEDCLTLLHCHIGSQVSDIRRVKDAVTELARVYAELSRLGAGLHMLDVGGGLGVDYDGSQTSSDSSTNYTVEEYASDVVYRIAAVCSEAGVSHPTVITESGRALSAYHSVLVFDVVGATTFDSLHSGAQLPKTANGERDDFPQPIRDLMGALDLVTEGKLEEAYHDAVQAHDEAQNLFRLGHMELPLRARAESLYWTVCLELGRLVEIMEDPPEELASLPEQLSDIYFCNLSVFQSLPDSWAIGQLFPIVPISRLDEEPDRRAVLADMTCDSEGKIAAFVAGDERVSTLPLHSLRKGERYTLAAFLVGAYQEILGDYHNLFGDTHAVHISLDEAGRWSIEEVVEGDTVREVLSYVQYEPDRLVSAMRRDVEGAVKAGRLAVSEGRQLLRFFKEGIEGYTYLEEESGER